jgi:hypothetical protein
MMMPTDATLTQKLKERIIQLVQIRDEGILGAFHAYRKDGDFDGFKMRVFHKVLTPTSSRETHGTGNISSATTFQYVHPTTSMGGQRRRVHTVAQTSHDRYMPIILDLE